MRYLNWTLSALFFLFVLTHLDDVVALIRWVATVELR